MTGADELYSVTETNTASGNNTYTLTETGSNNYTAAGNDNAITGMSTTTTTGTDGYTLTEAGKSQSVSGTDSYTTTDAEDGQGGNFSVVTSATNSNGSFTTAETGNVFSAAMTISQSGHDRYDNTVLDKFNNTSDGANGSGYGMADFSPVGMPVLVGRLSTPAGVFGSVGNSGA